MAVGVVGREVLGLVHGKSLVLDAAAGARQRVCSRALAARNRVVDLGHTRAQRGDRGRVLAVSGLAERKLHLMALVAQARDLAAQIEDPTPGASPGSGRTLYDTRPAGDTADAVERASSQRAARITLRGAVEEDEERGGGGQEQHRQDPALGE